MRILNERKRYFLSFYKNSEVGNIVEKEWKRLNLDIPEKATLHDMKVANKYLEDTMRLLGTGKKGLDSQKQKNPFYVSIVEKNAKIKSNDKMKQIENVLNSTTFRQILNNPQLLEQHSHEINALIQFQDSIQQQLLQIQHMTISNKSAQQNIQQEYNKILESKQNARNLMEIYNNLQSQQSFINNVHKYINDSNQNKSNVKPMNDREQQLHRNIQKHLNDLFERYHNDGRAGAVFMDIEERYQKGDMTQRQTVLTDLNNRIKMYVDAQNQNDVVLDKLEEELNLEEIMDMWGQYEDKFNNENIDDRGILQQILYERKYLENYLKNIKNRPKKLKTVDEKTIQKNVGKLLKNKTLPELLRNYCPVLEETFRPKT